MSLLLDAIKKSGDKPKMELEAYQPSQSGSAVESNSQKSAAASRAASDNLFKSKKSPPARFRWNLGLVPTTLLICSVIGAAYGYYVWLQIQPPKQIAIQRISPPPAPVVAATPAPVAAPALVPLVPEIKAVDNTSVVVTKTSTSKLKTRENTKRSTTIANETPYLRGSTSNQNQREPVRIARKQEFSNIDQALASAYQSYQNGDSATAWQRYREVIGEEPHNRDALLGLAVIAQQRGQDEESQYYYRHVLQLDPRDPVANAGLAAFASGNKAEAESRLKQLIADQPNSATLYFALGNHYAEQSRWGEAQQAYFSAYSAEPNNAQFAFNVAISLDHLGQSKSAANYYELALKLDTSGNSGFDRGQAQQRLNVLSSATSH